MRVLALCLLSGTALAALPDQLAVQGFLGNAAGLPAPDGIYTVSVTLWDAPAQGTQLWKEVHPVNAVEGRFSVELGGDVALPMAPFEAGTVRWVQVQVDADPPLPRQPVVSTAYALAAGRLGCTGCVTATHLDLDSLDGALGSLGYVKFVSLAPVATAGTWDALTGKPTLAEVATAGTWESLTNEPTLAAIATTGHWDQLAGVPQGLADGDDNTTYSGANFALSNKACPVGAVVTGTDAAGAPVCSTANTAPDTALGWMLLHTAAAAACRGSTSSGGTGCCGNTVRVRNNASGLTCSEICSQNGQVCDAEVSIWGRPGQATVNGQEVGNFYNYGCGGTGNGGSEVNAAPSDVFTSGYWGFCCCRT